MKPILILFFAFSAFFCGHSFTAHAALPRDAVPLDAAEVPLNFRLHNEFSAPGGGAVRLGKEVP